jgi:hypothetical protein
MSGFRGVGVMGGPVRYHLGLLYLTTLCPAGDQLLAGLKAVWKLATRRANVLFHSKVPLNPLCNTTMYLIWAGSKENRNCDSFLLHV